jgi:hypothetical protein
MRMQRNDSDYSPKHDQQDPPLHLAARVPKKLLEVEVDGRATNGDEAI